MQCFQRHALHYVGFSTTCIEPRRMARIDFIIPVYNEAPALERFHASLFSVLSNLPQHTFRFFYVNDGSSDDTVTVLDRMAQSDPRIVAIELSRNFGHQAA